VEAKVSKEHEPLVWEAATLGYTRFITDSRYKKLRPSYRKWYRPICPNCGPRTPSISLVESEMIERLQRMKHRTMPRDQWDALNVVIGLLESKALSQGERA